jgi:hypothetical protein
MAFASIWPNFCKDGVTNFTSFSWPLDLIKIGVFSLNSLFYLQINIHLEVLF